MNIYQKERIFFFTHAITILSFYILRMWWESKNGACSKLLSFTVEKNCKFIWFIQYYEQYVRPKKNIDSWKLAEIFV